VVVDVVVLVQELDLFVVRVGKEAEAQSGVLPMIQRWIMIYRSWTNMGRKRGRGRGALNDCMHYYMRRIIYNIVFSITVQPIVILFYVF